MIPSTVSVPRKLMRWAMAPMPALSSEVEPRPPKSWSLNGSSASGFSADLMRWRRMTSLQKKDFVATDIGYQTRIIIIST